MTHSNTEHAWLHRPAMLVLLAAAAFVLWMLGPVLITAFGGVVFAVAVRRTGVFIGEHTPLRASWAVALVLLLILLLAAFGLWRFGTQLSGQFAQLSETLSTSFDDISGWLRGHGIRVGAPSIDEGQLAWLTTLGTTLWGLLSGVLLVTFVMAYLALSPESYRYGVILLFPKRLHERAAEVMDSMEVALWRWTLGKLLAMVLVGTLTGLALWWLEVPSAALLGLISGLLEFIPILGPWLAAIPAAIVAASVGLDTALWALIVYGAIQQLESWVITPLAERSLVAMPPAVTLLSIAAFSVLFGIPGLVFATPLALVLMVAVRMLYVGDVLDEELTDSRMPK